MPNSTLFPLLFVGSFETGQCEPCNRVLFLRIVQLFWIPYHINFNISLLIHAKKEQEFDSNYAESVQQFKNIAILTIVFAEP